MNTNDKNKNASDDKGARPLMLYGNMLDQMRYIEALGYVHGKDVLDIACGVGWGSYLFSKGGAKSVTGIDISENALRCAQKYYYNKNINYLLGNVSHIPLESSSLDVIVSFETFEHVENVDSLVSEFYRVARPNAILILSTPNGFCCKKNLSSNPENPYHFQEYLKKDIENFFDINNWILISYKGQNPMKTKSDDIKNYRRFTSQYWKLKKYESKYGFSGKILTFAIRKFFSSSSLNEPAYKESCMPKDIKEGYEPSTHFFVYKCLKQ